MCGVYGMSGRNEASVAAMLQACQHRGPDSFGLWHNDQLTLGHNLLSLRADPEKSRQPMVTDNGCVLSYNGELYNPGIADELDTRYLARMLERCGRHCLPYLDGMYAFARYDPCARTLLLARDRLGAKPLYYAELNSSLLFSSEIKGLLAAGLKPELDPIGLRLYLQFGYIPGPRTLLTGVSKLVPGECRLYSLPGPLLETWNTCQPIQPAEFDPKVYREKLLEAVRRCAISKRPYGVFLSGGLDSSSVLWALHELGLPLQTLSMRFEHRGERGELLDGDCDVAADLARQYRADHQEMFFTEEDYLGCFYLAFSCAEGISSKGLPAYLAAHQEARERGWIMVMTGEGGDELLTGYGRHAQAYEKSWPKPLRDPVAMWIHLNSREVCPQAWKDPELAHFDVYEYMKSWLPSALLQGDTLQNQLELEGVNHLAEDFLIRQDKLGMSQGLETRFPLLCEPFRSYALGLPSALKLRGGNQKWCSREAMRGFLPDSVINKPKSGWAPPTGAWLQGKNTMTGPLGELYEKALTPGQLPAVDRILDVTRVRERVKIGLSLCYLSVWADSIGLGGERGTKDCG